MIRPGTVVTKKSTVLVIHGHPRGDDDQKTAVEAILTDRDKHNIYITFTYMYHHLHTFTNHLPIIYQSFTNHLPIPGSVNQPSSQVLPCRALERSWPLDAPSR